MNVIVTRVARKCNHTGSNISIRVYLQHDGTSGQNFPKRAHNITETETNGFRLVWRWFALQFSGLECNSRKKKRKKKRYNPINILSPSSQLTFKETRFEYRTHLGTKFALIGITSTAVYSYTIIVITNSPTTITNILNTNTLNVS